MRLLARLGAALLAFASSAQAGDGVTAFMGATLIDGTGRGPVADAVVLVEGTRIAAAGPRGAVIVPPGARTADLTGKWIVPGLIDAHIHFFQSGGLYARPDIIDLRAVRPYAEERARVRAKLDRTLARYLASGVTGVVDVGGPMWNFAVRARAREIALAPRVAVAGPLLATYVPPALAGADAPIVRIASAEAARAEVRRQLAHGPDLIKIWFVFPGQDISADLGWVRAAIAEAHAGGVRVVAHATQRRVARALVEAGVDVLAHGIDDGPVDDELLALMKARGVVYITAFAVKEGYAEVLGEDVRLSPIERRLGDPDAIASFADLARTSKALLPPWVHPRPSAPTDPVMARNLARVHGAGIVVAAGSDAGNIGTLHGPALHRELEIMVTDGGLTPLQALSAATLGGAQVMGRAHDLGTLARGKLADFLILDADPLADIGNTTRIHRVVKGGVVYAPAEIMRASARD
jgi:imidazolonepropionase-like amidohydrolase